MRKAQVIFDITEMKTEVTVTDLNGVSEQGNQAKEIVEAIDINKWQES